MVLGAALEIAAAVIASNTEPSLVPWFTARSPGVSASMVHMLAVAQGQTQAMGFVVAAPFWLVMAHANRRATSDAPRIISAVLLAEGFWSLRSFGAPRADAVVAISVIICLVGTAAVILLFSEKLPRLLRRRQSANAGSVGVA